MQSNVCPLFYPLDVASAFSPYLYDFSKPSHIKNVLDTVTNPESGSGEVVLKGAQNYLNLGLESCDFNALIDFAVNLVPELAPFAYSYSALDPIDVGYFRMSIMLVMKALNTGLTEEGVQYLSLGILGSPCVYSVSGSTVTVTPTMAYSALRAMVFQSLAQKLAPAGISVFLKPQPVTVSSFQPASAFPCWAYLDFTGGQNWKSISLGFSFTHCFMTGLHGGDIVGTITDGSVPLNSLLFYVDAPSNMYDLLNTGTANQTFTLKSASTGEYLAGKSTKGFYWSSDNTGDAVFTALNNYNSIAGITSPDFGVTSNFNYPTNAGKPTSGNVTWCNPLDAQGNVQFVVPKQN